MGAIFTVVFLFLGITFEGPEEKFGWRGEVVVAVIGVVFALAGATIISFAALLVWRQWQFLVGLLTGGS